MVKAGFVPMLPSIRATVWLLAALLLLIPCSGVSATTVVAFDAEQLLRKSAHVFHGVCTDVFVRYDDQGRIVTDYSFMVTETLKGNHTPQVVFTLPGGTKHQRTTIIPGLSQHQLGDELILFLAAEDPQAVAKRLLDISRE